MTNEEQRKEMTLSKKCGERICPSGRYGGFQIYACGRPGKYNGKCGIHSDAAKERRIKNGQQKYENHRKTVMEIGIGRAVKLLEANGYKVTFLEKTS